MIAKLTPEPIRSVSARDLGYETTAITIDAAFSETSDPSATHEELTPLSSDDTLLSRARDLLTDHGGVIFVGPSGTGKSYFARRIAITFTDGDLERCRFIQFHPSYQYEDFMEGYRPLRKGHGFEMREQHFVELSRLASIDPSRVYVLVIDELSRGDPGRVFGEALTYLERSKRGIAFHLSSGTQLAVPENLMILATMNPLDRGASDVDAALDRRFAKVRMDPDRDQLRVFLETAGMDMTLIPKVIGFFDHINSLAVSNPYKSLGHTYFVGVKGLAELNRLWECQLQFHFEKAFPFDSEELASLQSRWKRVIKTDAHE